MTGEEQGQLNMFLYIVDVEIVCVLYQQDRCNLYEWGLNDGNVLNEILVHNYKVNFQDLVKELQGDFQNQKVQFFGVITLSAQNGWRDNFKQK